MFGRRGAERKRERERRALGAAAEYLLALVADDDDRVADAAADADDNLWVWAVVELGQRAVIELARTQGVSPEVAMRSLLERTAT